MTRTRTHTVTDTLTCTLARTQTLNSVPATPMQEDACAPRDLPMQPPPPKAATKHASKFDRFGGASRQSMYAR